MFLAVCNNPNVLEIILFMKGILSIIQIGIPVLLIVFIAIDLFKMVWNGDEQERRQKISKIFARTIAAVVVFFIPLFVDVVMGMEELNTNEFMACYETASEGRINDLYLTAADDAVRIAELTGKINDYHKAVSAVKKVKDEGQQKALQARLDKVKEKLKYNAAPGKDKNLTYNSTKSEQLISKAKQSLGVKYVWGGTDLNNGVDCSGFTQSLYKSFGINLPRTANEQAKASSGTVISSLSQAKPGDLLFYYKASEGRYSHVAIYMGDGKRIHASGGPDCVKTATSCQVKIDSSMKNIALIKRVIGD